MDTSPDSEAEHLRQEWERLRQQLIDSEDAELLKKKRIARFAQYILSQETWFYTADKLIAAMKLLEPQIKAYWHSFSQDTKPGPEPNLTDVHMMLAGLAIENLCKGYLVEHLSPKDRNTIKGGSFPKSLNTHNTLKLIESTGMTLSDTEKYLIDQIYQANWRGRYPGPTSHEDIRPFVQGGSDIRWITTILLKLRARVGAKTSSKVS
jgi:hypothetical protein